MDVSTGKLSQLPTGESALVRDMELAEDMKRRLYELGLIPGTRVRCLQRAPAGSPLIYEIRGAAIALRKSDAEHIRIREATPWV